MKSTLSQPIARFAIYLEAYVLILGPVIQDFRLLHIAEVVAAIQFYVTFPLQTTAFAALVLFRPDVKKWRMDWTEMFIIFVAVWALIITSLYLGGIQDIASNFLRILLVYFCYRAGRDIFAKESEEDIWKLQNFFGRCGAWGVLFGVLFLYGGVFAHHEAYLGLSTEVCFLSFAVVLAGRAKNRTLLLIFLGTLIVMGGKRGNMLSLLAMLLAYGFFVLKSGKLSTKTLRNSTLGFSAIALAMVMIFASGSADLMSAIIPVQLAKRFETLTAMGEGGSVDVTSATAGRNFEVDDVMEQWKNHPVAIWTGFGLGAQITLPTGEKVNTVHISPIALAHIYGAPVGFGLFLLAWWLAVEILFLSRPGLARKTDIVWCLVAIGLLTTSLSVYIIMQNPLIWLCIGALSGRKRQALPSSIPASLPHHA